MFNQEITAIDVGFGTTCVASNVAKDGKDYVVFPSRVVPVDPDKISKMGQLTGVKRATIIVEVDKQFYEVGPDVLNLSGNKEQRQLTKQYISSSEYKALFRAGLNQIKSDYIHLLVGGLLINMLEKNKNSSISCRGSML